MFCDEQLDEYTKTRIEQRNNIFTMCWIGTFDITYITGSYILFIRHKNRQKPTFVKVIWLLIAIWIISKVTGVFVAFEIRRNKLNQEPTNEMIENILDQVYYFEMSLIGLIHYIFAIQYFGLALKLPLIISIMSVGGR